jgi:phosphatidate phosphatase APP1
MKRIRLKDPSVLRLFGDPYEYKLAEITAILRTFPERRFALIGDSGEKDPETYGELARRFPEQIVKIAIRDVTDEPADADRYDAAFRDVPPDRWQVFDSADEITLPIDE